MSKGKEQSAGCIFPRPLSSYRLLMIPSSFRRWAAIGEIILSRGCGRRGGEETIVLVGNMRIQKSARIWAGNEANTDAAWASTDGDPGERRCGTEGWCGMSSGMKSLTVELPERLAEELQAVIEAGWFTDEGEAVRLALRELLRQQRRELEERFQREDIAWALGLNEANR